MKKYAPLFLSLRTLAISSVLLLAGAANAGWGVSINVPLQTQTQYYGSTTVYGTPGAQIISTRQVPQTVCQPAWPGANTQQCTTQYVTVNDGYIEQAPVYVQPAPIYIAPNPVYIAPPFGYPGYGYNPYRSNYYQSNYYQSNHHNWNNEYNNRRSDYNRYNRYNNQPANGSLNIHFNGR